MTDETSSVESFRSRVIKIPHRKSSKSCVVLVIVIGTLVVSLPYAYSQLNPNQGMVQTVSFILESPNSSWCIGEARIWFEDGGFELLSPYPAIFKQSLLSESDVWQAIMVVERHFSEPVTCNLEYTCVELNMTITCLSFESNEYGIIFQDIFGNLIYLSGGYVDQ